MPPFSVLDLSPIGEGMDAAQAFRNTVELAQAAEALGYRHFWLAEHHNMTGVGSAATAVLIGHVAGRTARIRVGAGGIMLPNHAPLVVAEQFGTLASLYPERIDLGLGRAPGADMATAQALRRDLMGGPQQFPADVQELLAYFAPAQPGQRVRAVPGAGLRVPVWLLGSSLFSAQLAAALGLPYAFAAHFAPPDLLGALELYRGRFQPSEHLARPQVMVAVNLLVADSDEEARRQFTSQQQAFLNLTRGRPGPVPAPVATMDLLWSPLERVGVQRALEHSFVGAPATAAAGLERFLAMTRPDELMITAHIHDQKARLRSLELAAALHARQDG
ncbi:MAG: LLM class flavin-dependent oxidoreductase [Geminicoccaceae bacterium]